MDVPTATHTRAAYDVFEDDSPGEGVPGALREVCERQASAFETVHIERRDGVKHFRRTGKWIRVTDSDDETDPTQLASDLWELARKHADAHGSGTYRFLFESESLAKLESIVLAVASETELAEREVRESELVGVLKTLAAAYKEQASMYLGALEVANQLVEKQSTAMGYLADVKMVEEHYRNQREEREADLLEATEQARAEQKKWEALASIGIAIGSKLGDTLSTKVTDLWAAKGTATTSFRRLWVRFEAKDDLLRLFTAEQRRLWEAMANASTEDAWETTARAFYAETTRTASHVLSDAVALIASRAGSDLPAWMALAQRAGWVTDAT